MHDSVMQFSPRESPVLTPPQIGEMNPPPKNPPRPPLEIHAESFMSITSPSKVLAHRVIDLHHGVAPPHAYQHGEEM